MTGSQPGDPFAGSQPGDAFAGSQPGDAFVGSQPGDAFVVDARGLICPQPVIEAARASRTLPPGTVLEVWATDPAAALDLPAWCRMRGHELVEVREQQGDAPLRVVVRLR